MLKLTYSGACTKDGVIFYPLGFDLYVDEDKEHDPMLDKAVMLLAKTYATELTSD